MATNAAKGSFLRLTRSPLPAQSALSRAGGMQIVMDTTGLELLAAHAPEFAEKVVAYTAMRTAGMARLNIREVGAIDTSFMVNTTRARKISRFLWSIGTAAFYGVFVEFGTVRMGARPWLLPAMVQAFQTMEQILAAAFPAVAEGHVDIDLTLGGDLS